MTDNIAKKYLNEKQVNLSNYRISKSDKSYLNKINNLSIKKGFDIIYVMSPKYSDMLNKSYVSKHCYINNYISNFQSEYLDFNILGNKIGLNQRSFENGYIGYQHTSYQGAVQISYFLANHISEFFTIPRMEKKSNEDWKKRMNQKLEYYVLDRTGKNLKEAIYLGSEMKLFDDISVKRIYLIKNNENSHELIIEFNDSLNIKKIMEHKFYVHLYPEDKDGNIKEERKEAGYENYDFKPYLLSESKNHFFLSRKIESKIKNIKTLNLGLFKSGSAERSKELSFKQINLN